MGNLHSNVQNLFVLTKTILFIMMNGEVYNQIDLYRSIEINLNRFPDRLFLFLDFIVLIEKSSNIAQWE